MKKCPACGNEYADDATLCPVDGRRLVPKRTGVSIPVPRAFDVKVISPILSAGTYRVFIERSDLIFIQLQGGYRSILEALAPLLGPFGGLVPLVLWVFTRGQAKAKRQRVTEGDPEDLLRESESNFKLHQAEIREAAIEAPGSFGVTEKIGRLIFLVRHGEKIRCEFVSVGEMRRAILLLVPLLNSTFKTRVEWNEGKGRFEKKPG